MAEKTENEFGKFLYNARINLGFKTQKQLADITRISPATLSRLESGSQQPTPDTLKQIASHLQGISYEALMEKAGYLLPMSTDELKEQMKGLRELAEKGESNRLKDSSAGRLILVNKLIRDTLVEMVECDERLQLREENDSFSEHYFHVTFASSASISFVGYYDYEDGRIAIGMDGDIDGDTAYDGKYDETSIKYWLQKILLDWYARQLLQFNKNQMNIKSNENG